MNHSAIFSKTGKGVQEASGKSSHLSRGDRGVLAAIDGKTTLGELQGKFEKLKGPKFETLIKQLDKDGFIREVSSAPSSVAQVRPAAPAAKAAPKSKAGEGDDLLDFTQPMDKAEIHKAAAAAAAKPPAADPAAAARADAARRKEQLENDFRERAEAEAKARAEAEVRARAEAEAKVNAAREAAMRLAADAKAKIEAEAKAKDEAKAKAEAAEREKARIEAELGAKLEAERKAREAAERRAIEAVENARSEIEQTSKRQAEELRKFLAAEMQAKLDEERKAREAEDRKRREEEDRRRAEEDEARAREDVKRRAREETDRKKRDEEDRRRRADDERHREEEKARRAKEEAERRERDEADRKRRDEEESRRKKEEEERRAKEDGERKAKSERKAKEEAERKAKDDAERRAKEEAEAKARAAAPVATLPPVPAAGDMGSLLGDLESFGKREEEELKAKEEAERKAKEEAERVAREDAERRAKEEAERKAKEEAERKEKEAAERKAREELERRAGEEARRIKEEESERKRKAKEALAAKQAEERAARKRGDLDVPDVDVDDDDDRRDRKSQKAERAAAGRGAKATSAARPRKWGKPVAIALFVLLVGGVGALNLMPVSTTEYETAATEAIGAPVKIGSARMSVITGVELVFERVTIGDAVQVRLARGYPELGSLFGGRKVFSRIELEGATLSQAQVGEVLFGKAAGDDFSVGRLVVKQLNLDGPLKLPPLDVDAVVAGNGSLQSVKLKGPDNLAIDLTPKGSDVAFEIKAGTFALPFVPALSLSDFAMKGSANSRGVTASEFDGRAYDGVVRGTARVVWGSVWAVDGEVKVSGIRVGVFAPALMSEGRVEARANYSMSGATPATLYQSARMQGEFRIEKGVMGSFDITRALQTGGAQTAGRTSFNELTGQATYDRGAIQLRNISATAGAMNAGASMDIDANGGLSGRIVADVKAANQNLRATLNFSGKVQDPVIRK